jgi:predicted permease
MLLRRIRYWLESGKRAAALREEMELHIEEKAAELRDRGLSERDALSEARRRFGNVPLKQEESRDVWIMRWWSEVCQDVRYGVRTLSSQFGFTFAAVLTLVLGIGVNAVFFNVYNSLAFAPWGIRDGASAVQVWAELDPGIWNGMSWPHVRYLRDHVQSFEGLAAFSGTAFRVHSGDASWDLETVTVSGNYFDVLGTGFAIGRGFSTISDDGRDRPAEAVLHYDTWRSRFGGDPGVIGRFLEIGGHRIEIVGVAAAGFDGAAPNKPAIWLPAAWHEVTHPGRSITDADDCCRAIIGRLKATVTRQQAQAELNTLSAQFLSAAGQKPQRILLTSPSFLANPRRSTQFSTVLVPIAVAFFLILLLACANVSNLQLARGSSRGREIAVRLALGAGRGRVLRQLMVESSLLSSLAGIFSLAVSAIVSARIFDMAAGSPGTLTFRFENDIRVYAFVLLATFAAALLSGLLPAFQAVRTIDLKGLREGTRATARGWTRSVLLAAQVGLCAILLTGTMLLVRSLNHVRDADVGFDHRNLIVASTGLKTSGATPLEAPAMIDELAAAVASLPGVETVAWASPIPLGEDFSDTDITNPLTNERIEVGVGTVSAGFFRALGIPLLAGRDFSGRESQDSNLVIINEAMAQRLFPGENAVGRSLRSSRQLEVIGVVRNFSTMGFGSDEIPFLWKTASVTLGTAMLIRYSGPVEPLLQKLPARARELDRRFLLSAAPYSATIAAAEGSSRRAAAVAGVLAGLCLLVACVGIYGVAAYNAAQRTREMGIRLAMGAQPRAVILMVLRENLRTVIAGGAIGIAGAVAFGQLLKTWLYGVKPGDLLSVVAAISILLGASVLAAWFPARRCSRVDPAITLRQE